MKKKIITLLMVGVIAVSLSACGSSSDEPAAESTNMEQAADSIILDADTYGEYGDIIILNEGTDISIEINVYRVPSGNYRITNIGPYLTQVSIYKDEISTNEDGNEEMTIGEDGQIFLLGVEESKEVEIKDGYFIQIDSPATLELLPE